MAAADDVSDENVQSVGPRLLNLFRNIALDLFRNRKFKAQHVESEASSIETIQIQCLIGLMWFEKLRLLELSSIGLEIVQTVVDGLKKVWNCFSRRVEPHKFKAIMVVLQNIKTSQAR